MDELKHLLVAFAGLLLINAGLSAVLWARHRTPLYRAQFGVWVIAIASLVVQGLVQSDRWMIFAYGAVGTPMNLMLADLVGRALGLRCRWRAYLVAFAVGMAATAVFTALGWPFWARALPAAIGACVPLFDVVLQAFRLPRDRLTTTGRAAIAGTVILALHMLDYPFLRDDPSFAPIGFTIALLAVFALSISVPAIILESTGAEVVRLNAELELRIAQAERARSDAEAERVRAIFLAEAGRVLSSSLDYQATLGRIARLAISTLADFCIVNLITGDGTVQRVAAVHVDPERQSLLDELRIGYPPSERSPQPAARVMVTGRPELLAEVNLAALRERTRSAEHLDLMQRLGLQSHLAVPMSIGGRILGAISLGFVGARRYGPRDVVLAEALAARAALAIENARLFEEARVARGLAESASRSKDEFLAMLGHELRNPLAPIVTALQLIEAREGPSRERSVIERQARHLTRLVDDLLDVSRITGGKIELRRQPLRLRDAVERAIDLAGPLLEQRGHRLTVEVPPEGLDVLADPVRLAQIVTNLLTNAARYTEPGGHVTISAARVGDDIVLRVTDDGIGISPALLPRVFDLFAQGERSAERAQGGLGLGLTIVKTLVEAHGGTVEVHSEGEGRGSTFTVVLSATADPVAGDDASTEVEVDRARPGTTILVVDDNVDAAVLLGESLENLGYTTIVAHDPLEAIERARERPPDVAILDIGLPVMDGYELAQRLRQEPGLADLRLMAVTGYGQASDRERAVAAGFGQHLVKPVSIADVSAAVATLVREPR